MPSFLALSMIQIDAKLGLPLIGLISVGVIDRGSNLIQVRTHTACNMACRFCSTSANDLEVHPESFLVEKGYMLSWIQEMIRLKGCDDIEVNFDSVGEPSAYPDLVWLVSRVKALPSVVKVSMQTNGTLLDEGKIRALAEAGLDHVNLSIHTLDVDEARFLMGRDTYDLGRVLPVVDWVLGAGLSLFLTPVWLPGVNDSGICDLIVFAKEKGCGIGIQKYEQYKFSRRMKGVKQLNWFKFYRQLGVWEKEFGVKLKIGPTDLQIHRTSKIPLTMRVGDKVGVEILCPGWHAGQMVGKVGDRAVTVLDCSASIGSTVRAKIVDCANSIYLATPLR